MRVAAFDHQRKSLGILSALQAAGHRIVDRPPADLLLVDHDSAPPRAQLIDAFHADGTTVVMYPHGARPTFQYAGILEPDQRIRGQLVHGPGIADIYRIVGCPHEPHVVGWTYSPTVPFHAPRKIRRVLFAPHHPFGNGTMCEYERTLNADVARRLAALDVEVTVQMYGSPETNGVPTVGRWRYVPSSLDLDWRHIDQADAVIGDGTIAYLAIARGKPTVMVGNARQVYADDMVTPVDRWPDIAAALRYPVDTTAGPLDHMLELARAGTTEVNEWKERMIGPPLSRSLLVRTLESLAR
ncbi:MAG: hypothetical protein NUW01_12905 [Gemmatimonadaceae bacterium]|nr:hypothetical protein [Gemmatimonadaceae bacterium]